MRGYQKKVIFLKNVGSEIFDEAYFVLKCDEKTRIFSHATMVYEANRIIEENFGKRKRKLSFKKMSILFAFLIGFIISFILTFFLF